MEQVAQQMKETVHHVLAKSYFTFFLSIIIGIVLEYWFPLNLFPEPMTTLGAALFVGGTLLVFWAQTTTRTGAGERRSNKNIDGDHFARGPYRYYRNPTHMGLTMLVVGYGFILNALMIVITVFVTSLVSHFVFVKKEEAMLASKYPAYEEYKKKVRI